MFEFLDRFVTRTQRFIRIAVVAMALCAAGLPAAAQETAVELNTQGVELYNAGQWDDAVSSFRAAYELNPENDTIRRNLCNAYQSQADAWAKDARLGDACQALEIAVQVDANNVSPLIQLASYYLRLNETQSAIFRLEEAVQLAPDNLDARDLLGDAYHQANDLAAALAQWLEVQETQPNRPRLKEKIETALRQESVESKFKQATSRHFEISFAPETSPSDRRRVLTILEQAYRDIGRKFGNVYPEQTVHVLIYTADSFAESTGIGSHVGALYDGKIRAPISDANGNLLPDEEMRRRLYHEYTHAVIRYLLEDRVPWWLNEGLAETFSREFSADDNVRYLAALESGQLPALSTMESNQLEVRSETELPIAYLQAFACTSYLWEKFGQRSLITFIDNLGAGESFEDALKLTYRRDYNSLMKEVSSAARR